MNMHLPWGPGPRLRDPDRSRRKGLGLRLAVIKVLAEHIADIPSLNERRT